MEAVMQINGEMQLMIDKFKVAEICNMSVTTIFRKTNKRYSQYDPTFPLPVDAGVNTNLWRYKDIVEWVANRPSRKVS